MTQEEINKIMNTKLDYKKSGMFLHCENCLKKFLKSADYKAGLMSPQEFGQYEMASYPFTYPDGATDNIIVLWCRRCGKRVWDSRHMTHLF